MDKKEDFRAHVKVIYRLLMALSFLILAIIIGAFIVTVPSKKIDKMITEHHDEKINLDIVDGIHISTGLVEGEGVMEVVYNCTGCHSSKLITQNRMSKDMWLSTIKWMQETQNLHDLGNNEDIIVNYLATNYAPEKKGRREALQNIEWYQLDETDPNLTTMD